MQYKIVVIDIPSNNNIDLSENSIPLSVIPVAGVWKLACLIPLSVAEAGIGDAVFAEAEDGEVSSQPE